MRTISPNESGRSLVEMLGTIAIITMLTIGGITATRAALNTFRTNSTADQIEQVAQGVMDLYSWKKNYNGVGTDAFWQKNCSSINKPCNNGKFKPIVGIDMIVKGSPESPADATGFTIKVTDIPAVACRTLKNKTWVLISKIDGTCPSSRYGSATLTFTIK